MLERVSYCMHRHRKSFHLDRCAVYTLQNKSPYRSVQLNKHELGLKRLTADLSLQFYQQKG